MSTAPPSCSPAPRRAGADGNPQWEVLRFSLPAELSRYLVEKGSITVDGISLTVVEAAATRFTVSLIPATLAPHHAGPQGDRRAGQPRGRRDRQVRRAAARRPRFQLRRHRDVGGLTRDERLGQRPQQHGVQPSSAQHIKWSDMVGNLLGLGALALGWRRSMLDAGRCSCSPASCCSRAYASGHLSGSAGKQLIVVVVSVWGWYRWRRGVAAGRRTSPSASRPGPSVAYWSAGRSSAPSHWPAVQGLPEPVLEPLARRLHLRRHARGHRTPRPAAGSSSGSPGSRSTWSACRSPSTAATPSPA